jgi:hypothetical protein
MALEWPLLTGGRYSEVVVRTGLTVLKFKLIFNIIIGSAVRSLLFLLDFCFGIFVI